MKKAGSVIIFFLAFVMSGCGQSSQDTPKANVSEPGSSPVGSTTKKMDPATVSTIKGKVTFEGQAPAPKEILIRGNPECSVFHKEGKILSEELVAENDGLRNVFVYIKEGLEGYQFDPPSEPVTISNKSCVYTPHVSGAQAGQPVALLNEDNTLHNVHTYSKNNRPFNLGFPFQGMKQTKKFDAAEIMVTLKCDVHPWMIGYLGVVSHPCFAVSGPDGSFELKNLPPGEYTIEAWHEKLGVQSQKIKIGPQETKEIQFRFS